MAIAQLCWKWNFEWFYCWLWPFWSPSYGNVCIFLSFSIRKNSSIMTLWLNITAPKYWIQLKFGTLINFKTKLNEDTNVGTAISRCHQLSTDVNSYHNCQKSMLEASYQHVCFLKFSRNRILSEVDYLNISVAQKLTQIRFVIRPEGQNHKVHLYSVLAFRGGSRQS